MTCNELQVVFLTCEQIESLIHALGAHSGAEMNEISQMLQETLDNHDHNDKS